MEEQNKTTEEVSIIWKQLPAKNSLIAKTKPLLDVEVTEQTVDGISKACKEIDKFCKAVKNDRLECTRKLDEIKKQYMDQEKNLTSELLDIKANLQGKVSEFLTAKEKARIEAEKERLRLEAEAEMARQEAEAERQRLEKEKAQAEIASLFGRPADQPAEPLPPPPPMPVVLPPKVDKIRVDNVRQVKVACWEILDPAKLPREFLSVDESKIRAFANDKMKAGIELDKIEIDGIRFFEKINAQLR